MSRPGYHTLTLGCKLNRFDSAAVEAELERRGYAPEPDLSAAAVVVVNTCAVTGKADAEARRLVRRVRRANPACRLLVTGCYAELDAGAILGLRIADRVFGNRDKPRLKEILDEMGVGREAAPVAEAVPRYDHAPGRRFGNRGRAFLKIQEGCDLACAYCVIPRVRGRSRSVPKESVERDFLARAAAGYREIVLTGVNTGAFGHDLAPRLALEELVRSLLRVAGPVRIRLNSLEPLTVTDGLLRIMSDDPRLAPHVQVPLQSGSDEILRSMRRNYRTSQYLERVSALREAVPDAAIGADVIVGFPGETDARFEETLRFVERSPLNYLHVFAWSPRPGVPAASLPGRPHGGAVAERSRRLREVGERKFLEFRRRFEGRELDAVLLGGRRDDGRWRALTGNFIEAAVAGEGLEPRHLVRVRVVRAERSETLAVAEGLPNWAG
ncbi:MAG: tRNA (N(6)-L-threonylcarbamoyladenosine(37)-C(2))-methylthiotransferase MtaB [Acidobacteriia bacterium]|nr:tRNA (N(6)-L-threonylcarbamoyladenosine(37)-C(2))-methylthiotransferase MtaB [Terriglobia bacterium]